jgi:hypothetical protein
MKLRHYLFLCSLFVIASCGTKYDAPPSVSSVGYEVSGMRFIPKVGTPGSVAKVLNEKLTLARYTFTSSPLAYPDGKAYVVGTRDGKIITFSGDDSLKSIDTLQTESPVQELLVDSSAVVVIQTNGHLTYLPNDRTHKWTIFDSTPVRCNSIYTGSKIIVATDSSLIIYPVKATNKFIVVPYTLSPRSLAYDNGSKLIYLALTANSSDGTDSILCISEEGKVVSRSGFPNMRISSNLTLTSGRVAFGYFGDLNPQSSVRRTYVVLYEGIAEGKAKQIAKQETPYIVMNIASNGKFIFTSGFRERTEELASGIDAFSANDLEKRWQRRFSEPLVAPIAVSSENIYFTLSFETNAETPSNGILYILSAETGTTEREQAIEGVKHGFAAGMPMPLSDHSLLLSDNEQPIIYSIRP